MQEHEESNKIFNCSSFGKLVVIANQYFNIIFYIRLWEETGRVQFSNAKERVILVENEEASFLVSENSIHKTSATTSVRRNFVFEHTPLEEVLAQLSQAFDMTISLESSNLGNAELSADFENEKIENIVSIIETTFCLTSKKTENGYLLLGKGCK